MKPTFTSVRRIAHWLFVLTLLFSACEKPWDATDKPTAASHANRSITNITGSVTDGSGMPMAGVSISVDGHVTTTNSFGIYMFQNVSVNNKRFVVKAYKPGFLKGIRATVFSKKGGCHYVNITLMPVQLAGTVNAPSGGTVSLQQGASVSFPPGSFVDASGTSYTGVVKIYASAINQDTPGYANLIPGGDLRGMNTNGKEQVLTSFGMMNVELTSASGQPLQLAPQASATLQMPLAVSQSGAIPGSVPLWYLDEETGLWMEEGLALNSGSGFEGQVKHFTWWNFDLCANPATISGRVVDCLGVPIPNVTILFNNQYTLTTDNQGNYSALFPENTPLIAQVLAGMNPGIGGNSNIINSGNFAGGSVVQLPDLIVPCQTSRLEGVIKDCNGNLVSGFIIVTGSQTPASYYTATGSYNILVQAATPVNLLVYSANETGNVSMFTGNPGATIQVPDILVCTQQQHIGMEMNGDGYVNKDYEVSAASVQTFYNGTGPTTGIIISGYTVPDNKQCLIQIDFCGGQSGHYGLGPGTCNSDVSVILDGVAYYPDDANSVSDFISITQYGNAAGKMISGTYFTHLLRGNTGGPGIPITVAGTFNVIRQH